MKFLSESDEMKDRCKFLKTFVRSPKYILPVPRTSAELKRASIECRKNSVRVFPVYREITPPETENQDQSRLSNLSFQEFFFVFILSTQWLFVIHTSILIGHHDYFGFLGLQSSTENCSNQQFGVFPEHPIFFKIEWQELNMALWAIKELPVSMSFAAPGRWGESSR